MNIYAIGDIHGCYLSFRELLKKINFSKNDRLFLTGDLVNRGPRSLEVLEYIFDIQNQVNTVLGNHDLHLLAYAYGALPQIKINKDLEKIINCNKSDILISWLKNQPLILFEESYIMVHAGILPCWDIKQIKLWAKNLESILKSSNPAILLKNWYEQKNYAWNDKLNEEEKLSLALNAFTKIRMCPNEYSIDLKYNDEPEKNNSMSPWFNMLKPNLKNKTWIFGHWAALGLRIKKHYMAIDSGCVWGNYLSAIRLLDGKVFIQNNIE